MEAHAGGQDTHDDEKPILQLAEDRLHRMRTYPEGARSATAAKAPGPRPERCQRPHRWAIDRKRIVSGEIEGIGLNREDKSCGRDLPEFGLGHGSRSSSRK